MQPQREYMTVDPRTLAIDMPVDPDNVAEKEISIAANGIVQPILVWLRTMQIIDGFHRVVASLNLNLPEIPVIVVDCDEEAFWDARIQSAKQHVAIADARLAQWMYESWGASPLAVTKTPEEFFQAIYDRRLDLGTRPEDEMSAWFKVKCATWGRRWIDVARLLLELAGIRKIFFDPRNIDDTLSFADARTVTSAFGNHLAREVEREDAREFLASGRPATLNEGSDFLRERKEAAIRKENEERALRAAQQAQFLATEQGKRVQRKQAIDNAQSDFDQLFYTVKRLITPSYGVTLEEAMAESDDLKRAAMHCVADMALLLGQLGHHVENETLLVENQRLTSEVEMLRLRIGMYESAERAKLERKAKKAAVLSSTDIEMQPEI